MRVYRLFIYNLIVIGILICSGLGIGSEKVRLDFDHYYDSAELTASLKALEKAYPDLMTLQSAGKSYQGRDIWAVILNNPKTGAADHKPGFYIDGNIHGNEIQGGEVALYTVWYLLTHYGETELATRLLDERAFYVIPTMNPDSRDYYIHQAVDPNSPRTGLVPLDEDRDGVADEDGPEDLDGNGSITQMRKKDPRGDYRVDPEDPRIMTRVKPGETGEYILLGREGIDNDGDGRINEDGPGGYDMNRNYGYGWQPSYVQRGAGYYPFCWPETKAIRDFLLAHPNIVGAQNFHNTGGMILKGPGAKSIGAYPPADQRVYDYIGKLGEKLLPKYRYLTIYSGLYSVYGGSIDYLYSILGIFTFSNELDMSPFGGFSFGESDEPESEEMREFRSLIRQKDEMLYHDRVLMGEHYADWKPYHHPLYGDIEIGGVKKFGRRVSTLFNLPSTCHRNAAFCLFHADQLPRLAFDEVKVEAVGNGTFRIDVTMANSRVTPSISAEALQNALYRADRLKVTGKGIRLVAAGKLIDRFRGITEPVKTQDNFVWIKKGIPGFSKVDFSLLVKGQGKATLIYDSLKGGYKEYTVDVK